MLKDLRWRDYSLTGVDAGPGFAPAEWYSTPIPRKRLKELMRRSDRPGLINYGLWLVLLVASGAWLIVAWGSWWAVPAACTDPYYYVKRPLPVGANPTPPYQRPTAATA